MASSSALTLRTVHAKAGAFAAADNISNLLGITHDVKNWGNPPPASMGNANQRCPIHRNTWLWESINAFLQDVQRSVTELQAAPPTKPTKPSKTKANTVQT